jgi:hypothetical protein
MGKTGLAKLVEEASPQHVNQKHTVRSFVRSEAVAAALDVHARTQGSTGATEVDARGGWPDLIQRLALSAVGSVGAGDAGRHVLMVGWGWLRARPGLIGARRRLGASCARSRCLPPNFPKVVATPTPPHPPPQLAFECNSSNILLLAPSSAAAAACPKPHPQPPPMAACKLT